MTLSQQAALNEATTSQKGDVKKKVEKCLERAKLEVQRDRKLSESLREKEPLGRNQSFPPKLDLLRTGECYVQEGCQLVAEDTCVKGMWFASWELRLLSMPVCGTR